MEILNRLSRRAYRALGLAAAPFCAVACGSVVSHHITHYQAVQEVRQEQERRQAQAEATRRLLLAIADDSKPSPDAIEILLQAGASVEGRDDHLATPLNLAAEKGRFDLFPLLLRHGARVSTKDVRNITPLLNALEHDPSTQRRSAIKLLLEHGADPNAKYDYNFQVCQVLHCGQPLFPLTQAVFQNDTALTELLLQHGAQASATDARGESALFIAARNGNKPIVHLLLKYGAKVDEVDDRNETALFAAIASGHASMVQFLLENGANINVRNQYGVTPLMCAATTEGSEFLIPLLVSQGAKTEQRDKEGKTAFLNACNWFLGGCAGINAHFPKAINHLVACGANVDAVDANGNTALHLITGTAVAGTYDDAGTSKTMQRLLAQGVNPNLRNKVGKTALHLLAEQLIDEVKYDSLANVTLAQMKVLVTDPKTAQYRDRKGHTPSYYLKKAYLQNPDPTLQRGVALLSQ